MRTSGLETHYTNEREGQDRLENLQEVVNAAAAFVQEEGYGLDTPARSIPLRPGATNAPEIGLATANPAVDVLDAASPADPAQNPRQDDAAGANFCRMRRWKPATTRRRPGRTPCS